MIDQRLGYLELDAIRKSFGESIAVDKMVLSVDRGERVALLGPSGCGKTTTLNMIAGFLSPDVGSIRVAGRDITSLPAHRRNTGMVFQQYALFPHLTVARNVNFGLRMRGVKSAEIEARVTEALALVRLQSLANRLPRELSGGQQQRVAVARALVIRPDILLLDEPLSNLDAKLRREMRTEMLRLLGSVGVTTILVTHDQEEALALANRIAVMNQGRIEQIGSPAEVFENPATSFVARFLGDPNVLHGRVAEVNGNFVICDIDSKWRLKGIAKDQVMKGSSVDILVRGERIQLTSKTNGLDNSIPVRIEHAIYLGNNIRYIMRLDEHVLAAVEGNHGQQAKSNADLDLLAEWSAKDTLVFRAQE
jgi:putative spermidine/putrescine transport system ATP-binding protein